MSNTEFHYGRMKEITLSDNQTIEDFFKEKSDKEELRDYYDTWTEQYLDDTYGAETGQYILVNDKIYEIIEHYDSDDNDSYMKIIKNSDESLTFIGSFYNGGTCFSEMLEEALKS